jgi:transcriptional regulator with XRE-family HTH domain
LTQIQLGELVHADQSTIWRWERGENQIPEGRLGELARVLKVPKEYFTMKNITEELALEMLVEHPGRKTNSGNNGRSAHKRKREQALKAETQELSPAEPVLAPVLDPSELLKVVRREVSVTEAKPHGKVWHSHQGVVLAVRHAGPPFARIQGGCLLLVLLDPEIIVDGRLYLVTRNGGYQIRRARLEGENINVSRRELVGELLEARFPTELL